jgi:hypothetical protein
MFIGPLNSSAASNDGHRPFQTYLTDLRNAANVMRDAWNANGITWCVWSRQNAALVPVTHVQTDDAWDTQRRRGLAPTTRVTLQVT